MRACVRACVRAWVCNSSTDDDDLICFPSGEVGDFEQHMCGEGYIQELAILPTIVS